MHAGVDVRRPLAGLLAAALLAAGVGCAGSRVFDGRRFRGPETAYRVGRLGPGWRPLRLSGAQADVAFHHQRLAATVHTFSSCDPQYDIPLRALTAHLLIGTTDRQLLAQRRRPLDGRASLWTHVRLALDGVPREMLLVVLKKDGCLYDLVLSAPPGERFERARRDFERFVAGFATRERSP